MGGGWFDVVILCRTTLTAFLYGLIHQRPHLKLIVSRKLSSEKDFFTVGVGGEREHSQAVDERVEGGHFIGKRAEGSSIDESAGSGLFPVNTEVVTRKSHLSLAFDGKENSSAPLSRLKVAFFRE